MTEPTDTTSRLREPSGAPRSEVYRFLRRLLELAQDFVILLLLVLLTLITLRALWSLFELTVREKAPVYDLLSQIVWVLILTEFNRILIAYLREHQVSVGLIVEVALVSILRDLIILIGAGEYDLQRIGGFALLLVVLGGLLALERRYARPAPPHDGHPR